MLSVLSTRDTKWLLAPTNSDHISSVTILPKKVTKKLLQLVIFEAQLSSTMKYLFILVAILLFAYASSSESQLDGEKKTTGSDQQRKDDSNVSPFTELLGETLYRWKINGDNTMEVEELPTADLLKSKTAVAIYFSASWCGPCKQFTPVLAQLYKSLNKKGKKFEVVWLSRDRSSEEFLGYYQQMPWLAVTLQNIQPVLEKIAPKYQLKVKLLLAGGKILPILSLHFLSIKAPYLTIFCIYYFRVFHI